MKKILSFILFLAVIVNICITPTNASNERVSNGTSQITIYSNGDVELKLDNTVTLTNEKERIIISYLVDNSDNQLKTDSLLCLFGHKMEYTDAYKYTHNYYSTAPRCKCDVYNVGICTRCEHTETELKYTTRVGCH